MGRVGGGVVLRHDRFRDVCENEEGIEKNRRGKALRSFY
jgi:hypothetical protein